MITHCTLLTTYSLPELSKQVDFPCTINIRFSIKMTETESSSHQHCKSPRLIQKCTVDHGEIKTQRKGFLCEVLTGKLNLEEHCSRV